MLDKIFNTQYNLSVTNNQHTNTMNKETQFKITEAKGNRNVNFDIINGSDLDNFCIITEQISQTSLGIMIKKMNELIRGKGEAVVRAAILPNGNVSVDLV